MGPQGSLGFVMAAQQNNKSWPTRYGPATIILLAAGMIVWHLARIDLLQAGAWCLAGAVLVVLMRAGKNRTPEGSSGELSVHAVAGQMSYGVTIMDAQGRIEWINESLSRMTGYELAEIEGRVAPEMLAGSNTSPAAVGKILEQIKAGEAFELETSNSTKDGRLYWAHLRYYPMRDEAGKLVRYVSIAEEITEKREMWERLSVSERRSRLIIDTAMDAVVLLDHVGSITGCNPQANAVFGRDMRKLIGKPFVSQVIAPNDRPRLLAVLHETGVFGEQNEGVTGGGRLEINALRSDGAPFEAELSVSALASGEKFGTSVFIRDISRRKRDEMELREAKDRAEAANRAKSDFLAMMSHEIRTPLNGVVGMIDLLWRTNLNEGQQHYAQVARSSADSLLSVINDILDFSKIEAGRMEMETLPFDLITVVEDLAESVSLAAVRKGIELSCSVGPDVPRHVLGDPGRLRQVLLNLLNNAIKFTESGHVVIRAKLMSEGDDGHVVRFSIVDTGIGISADRLAMLFNPFTQVDASTTRKYGGTGLGLVISKRLAELMGGAIGVESAPGKGSTFWFEIRTKHAAADREVAAAAMPGDMPPVRVLAVDDNDVNREILQQLLTNWKLETATAPDGETALALMNAAVREGRPFGLAILDWHMPGMDGIELAQKIRASETLKATPLLMLTSIEDQSRSQQLKSLNLAGHLIKPVRQSKLAEAIVSAVRSPAAAPVAGLPGEEASRSAPRSIRILLAEDNEINQMVAAGILKDLGYNCEIVDNGRSAYEAVCTGRYDLLLLDCQMPVMDGFEAARAIRRREAQRAGDLHIPIIALTANAIKGDREACLSAGMDDYVAKPIDPDELQKAIDVAAVKWLHHVEESAKAPAVTKSALPAAHAVAAVEEMASQSSTSPMPVQAQTLEPPVNLRELHARCMNNVEFAKKILAKFQSRVGDDIRQLVEAVGKKEFEIASRLAHSLKGSAANLSAEELRAVAAELEKLSRARDLSCAEKLIKKLELEARRCVAFIPEAIVRLAAESPQWSSGKDAKICTGKGIPQ